MLPRFQDITMKGELGARYAAATCNLFTHPDRYSIESYRAQSSNVAGALWLGWPGDQLGRMLSAMHVAEGYGWTPIKALRSAVADVSLPCQTKDGNFGQVLPLNHNDECVMSGNAFALRGLTDAYEDTHEERYLNAARTLGRYFEATFPTWEKANGDGPMHEFYGHCIDGLVKLYELGRDTWALGLAKRIGAKAGRTKHTHHSLSMYRGMLDLYRVTTDPKYFKPTEDYLKWCKESSIVTGGVAEWMPSSEEDEGCALADYVVVNLMAFAATGADRFLDDAEHVMVNHFFMNQFQTGGFGHRAFAMDVIGGKKWQGWEGKYGSENPGCCSIWGLFGLGQIGRYIVTKRASDIEVNLYPCADINLGDVRLSIESDFPRMRSASVTSRCDNPRRFRLSLRVPGWSEGVSVKVNGRSVKPASNPHPGPQPRLTIEREWRSGDTVEIVFKGGLRLVPWPDANSGQVGVFDGPLCLGLSSADADVDRFTAVELVNGKAEVVSPDGKRAPLRPICEDWQSPNVAEPNRIRVLFRKPAAPSP